MKSKSHLKRCVIRIGALVASLIAVLLPVRYLTTPRNGNNDDTAPARRLQSQTADAERQRLALAAMRAQVMNARPLAMYYSLDDSPGMESLLRHASVMTVFAPQCYWLDHNGNIQGGISPDAMDAAGRAQLPVMALLYNRDFSRDVATLLLHNADLQRNVIRNIAAIARQGNLLGFQLDFENIDPNDENLYSRFVRETAKALHKQGRLLSVAVVPQFLGALPNQWSAAYDYPALAHSVDFLTLMAYDNSGRLGPPGPIAGYKWVKNAIEFAVRRVPPDKLLLGIPLYGREWIQTADGFQAHTMPYPQTKAVLDRLSIRPEWDEKQRSPWFEYRADHDICRVWYENARSIGEKLQLVEKFHLRGFAAWRLGVEDPHIWSLVTALHEDKPVREVREYAPAY